MTNIRKIRVAVLSLFAVMFALGFVTVSCQKEDNNLNGENGGYTHTNIVDGALPGVFSVGDDCYVHFSQGNLQYTTTGTHAVAGGGTASGTWRFASNQWDTIGADNSNISSSYSGWIDLFGWGTSGWNSGTNAYQPYSTSFDSSDYYPGGSNANSLTGTYANADCGVYNAISNGGNQPGLWRTLTQVEWNHLINSRQTASGIRYAHATVNGVPGLIIVPDNWSTSIYNLDSTNISNADFNTNVLTSLQWGTLENAGCVFLPAEGYRNGSSVGLVGACGFYWSTTSYNSGKVYCFVFSFLNIWASPNDTRYMGYSVRLVQDVN